jgi:ERCC4-related helicase
LSSRGEIVSADSQTIAQFKEGVFNVLVSTSIGEEGLDIGEVDFVVIYDMPKQSIKLVHQAGLQSRILALTCSCSVSGGRAGSAMAKSTC